MSSEQTQPTLADYVALALSPALIMGLVGSLVFFLLEVCYAGQYEGRLQWILFFFVFGAVLIARVSMTAHISDRAGLYGCALGFATFLGMQIFVEYPKDSSVAEVSWLINIGLLGIVWWCAHRLTWDCTHIEEESDAGGGGLLEAAGFEPSSESPTPAPEKEEEGGLSAWWARYQRYREANKKRTLGVWVVYFSLAALPLFGLGQSLIPVQATARRQYVFWLMTLYVGCGLGLLLSTCFLGLRRYLRQRKLRMPGAMTGAWLMLGGGLISVLLLAGAFLPRPQAEYPLIDFTPIGSEKRTASDYAVKSDSPSKGKGRPGSKGDPKGESGNAPGKQGEAGGDQGKGKEGSGQGKDGSGKGKDSSGQGKGNSGQGQGNSGQDQSGQSNQGEQGEQGSEKGEKSGDSVNNSNKGEKKAGEKARGEGKGGKDGKEGSGSRTDDAPRPGSGKESNSRSGSPDSSPLKSAVRSVAGVLKWVVFVVLALLVLFFVLRGILQFLANFTGWARGLLDALRNFWASLFAGRKREKAEAQEETSRPASRPQRPFSSYSNPFEDGSAQHMSAHELIRYTFAAVQAWARERDLGRQTGETPLEFVGRVAGEVPTLEDDLRPLVMLYGRAVYGRGALPANATETVRQFWNRLLEVVEHPLSA
jgi:hypothetical protein